MLISIIIGYKLNGLTGLGIGYLVYHIIDMLFIKLIVTKNYKFYFNKTFNKLFYVCIFQFLIMLCLFYIENEIVKYSIMVLIILVSITITIVKLNQHFNLMDLLKRKIKK